MTVTWEELGWERLAPGVGRCRLPGWDCTVGLVLGAGTALVVDAGSSPAEGERLRTWAQQLAGHGVTHLALTHPHFDHVFGTAAFAGVRTYAAVGTDAVFAYEREELRRDAVRHGLPEADAAAAVAALAAPRHLVSGEWTLDLGDGRQVLLANVGPGHTAHDLAVLVPGSVSGTREIVFCGDLVEESGEPQAGPDAVPSRWPDALDRLLALGGKDALYVPGHGAVVDAVFVRRQRDELAARFGVS
ncbi:MBL fold metallo-hydrolase [Streptomyces sp. PTD9-10]|uniref:MBL fold metallo-hydrolase n=1 Tax=Streptomyces sp. PTD9-10 TaxID=3120151 RepID=UPI00300BF20D